MKLVNYQESQISLNVTENYRTKQMELVSQTTNGEPVVLGTFAHEGFSLNEKTPVILTLTEAGSKFLSVLRPVKQEYQNAVVGDHLSESKPV